MDSTSADAALCALKPRLTALLDEAQCTWTDLSYTLVDYAELRREQRRILRAAGLSAGVHAVLRGLDALWDRHGRTPPTWPCAPLKPFALPPTSRAFLLWAVEHREHVWLPTTSEYVAEQRRYAERTNRTPMALESFNRPLRRVS